MILFTPGLFHSPQKLGSCKRNCDTLNLHLSDLRQGVLIGHSAGSSHKVDHDFIGNPYDGVFFKVIIPEITHSLIGKNTECPPNSFLVLLAFLNQEVDIFRCPDEPGLDGQRSKKEPATQATSVRLRLAYHNVLRFQPV